MAAKKNLGSEISRKEKKKNFGSREGFTVGREFYRKNKIMKNMEAKRDLGKKV